MLVFLSLNFTKLLFKSYFFACEASFSNFFRKLSGALRATANNCAAVRADIVELMALGITVFSGIFVRNGVILISIWLNSLLVTSLSSRQISQYR